MEYEKLDPITHIHKRPDMYIGSLKPRQQPSEWIWDDSGIVEQSPITFSDGFLRIFVEALSNAVDNAWRSRQEKVRVTKIRVEIDRATGYTSILNDGLHIPVEIHAKEQMYTPELIFGHLLSGSNLNDNEARLSSGRNGLGIKLLNVFSKEFSVEIYDPTRGQIYTQQWKNNMRDCHPPKIRKGTKKEAYTLVRWLPDFEKFYCQAYDDKMIRLYMKYVVDAAMLTGLHVSINEKKFFFKSFGDYVRLYHQESSKPEMIVFDIDTHDEHYKTSIAITSSPNGEYKEVGFVNGVYTRDGGVHCDVVASELWKNLTARFHKGGITTKDLKPHFMIFVNAWLINPEFSSQSKTKLLSPPLAFKMESRHVDRLMKWSFVEKIHELIRDKEFLSLKKTEKKGRVFKRIEGLDPANLAGTKHARDCTLILCEGLSAKTYATCGISVGVHGKKGRNYFGIYPLRGKCLNVRNASTKSISENKEITDVIQALNLRHGVDYRDETQFSTLRYGAVLIITDADEDGHHISSLLINMFHKLFPTLLERSPPFLRLMMTPIAKISYSPKHVETFYSDYAYQVALEQLHDQKVSVKYYKGLGTSSDEEVKETFGQKVVYLVKDETTDTMMNQIFHKNASQERKEWLTTYNAKVYTTPGEEYPLTLYFNQELIRFSIEDCRRSIPCLFDGFKVSQRKILYSVLKKNLSYNGKSMKVAQLAGYCAEHSNYHHGEQCLYDTIIKMAQEFPGSNNIAYFARDGQFGTRSYGGRDAANARYIFTKLGPLTRLLFPAEDDHLLSYTLDDGERVEPDYYVPILPTILGNGCSAGIGTGWSCSVPCFDFLELASIVKQWLSDREKCVIEPSPSYRGFRGTIEKIGHYKYQSSGILKEYTPSSGRSSAKKRLYEITELPIHVWTNKYKEELETMIESKKLRSLQNFSTPNTVHFIIEPVDGFTPTLENMKLQSTITLSNMVLFTSAFQLQKFHTLKDIFNVYAETRLDLYGTRKKYLVRQLENDIVLLKNKHRFLNEVNTQKIVVFRVPEDTLLKVLKQRGYTSFSEENDDRSGYSYLLRIPIRDFTDEKIRDLESRTKHAQERLDMLQKQTPSDMWLTEIDRFLQEYHRVYND